MSAEALEVRDRLVGKAKANLLENASIIISALAVFIASLALMFGGVAMFVAYDANEEAKIAGIRATNAEARLEAYVRENK